MINTAMLAMLRRRVWLALVGVALASTVWNIDVVRAQQSANTAPLVFDGVTVIDVQNGHRLPAQRVVIVGNRIRTMGNVGSVQMPAGARVVDARGKYMIPGLWDMHTHSFGRTDIFYPLFIANGVTGIRDAGSPVPLDSMIQWRRAILAGTRIGPPRQILSGPAIDETERCNRALYTTGDEKHSCVANPADARHVVDSLKAAGADMIKAYEPSRETYFAMAVEARRIGIPLGGHAPLETPIEASDSGARIMDHIQYYMMGPKGLNGLCWADKASASINACRAVVERFKHNDTWLVPTVIAYAIGGTDEGNGAGTQAVSTRFSQRMREFWSDSMLPGNWLRDSIGIGKVGGTTRHKSSNDSLGNMRIIHRVGLPILAGTDVAVGSFWEMPPGFSLHAELAIYEAEGMTPLEALQSATLNPAVFLHGTDSLGTVAPGKLADLVLLDADPLVDITNTTAIRAVVANGHYFDRAALDQLLTDIRAKAKHVL